MLRVFSVAGALVFAASLVFFGVSYAGRFAGDAAWTASGGRAAAIDFLLFTGFALHHSLFARTGLRAWIARMWPASLERSIYVWVASLLFLIVCAAWQPVPGSAWRLAGWTAVLLRLVQLSGVALVLEAARRLDVFSLAGVRQVLSAPQAPSLEPQAVSLDRGPYGLVRHPIYLGWFAIVWCVPFMNGTRLVFAVVSCLYLLVAMPFEERDLRKTLGPAYGTYATRVKWKLLPGVY